MNPADGQTELSRTPAVYEQLTTAAVAVIAVVDGAVVFCETQTVRRGSPIKASSHFAPVSLSGIGIVHPRVRRVIAGVTAQTKNVPLIPMLPV